MNIIINNLSETHVLVHLNGKITIENVELFDDELYPILNKKIETMFISLAKLDYIDSSGIGALIKLMNAAKNSYVDMILYNVSKETLNTLKASYLDNFFVIMTRDELKELYPDFKL